MAVTPLTSDDVVERFPVFTGQEDLIDLLIPEAVRMVDDSWAAEDTKPAMLYAVAHMVIMEGEADSLPVISESLGPISTSYSFDPKANPFTRTEYGRRYLAIRNRQSGGGIVVA